MADKKTTEAAPPASETVTEEVPAVSPASEIATAQADPAALAAPQAAPIDEDRVRAIFEDMFGKADTTPADAAPALTEDHVRKMIDDALSNAATERANASAPAAQPTDDRIKEIVAGMLDERSAKPAPAYDFGHPQSLDNTDTAAFEADAKEARQRSERASVATARARAKEETELAMSAASDRVLALASVDGDIDVAEPMRLRFGDNDRFIASVAPIEASLLDGGSLFIQRADQLVLDRNIDFDPAQPAATITEAWLIGEGGARRCEISGGLRIGAGSEARLPAGHLAFLIG